MKNKDYTLVLGASGNIGGKVAQELLQQGEAVAVLGRNYERLRHLEGKADLFIGDFADDALLGRALQQATRLFLTVPDEHLTDPAPTAARLGRLLQQSPVTHLVHISNAIVKRAGQTTRLVALEEELNQLCGLHVLHLRCGNFFDNLNWGLHTPYRPDLRLPYVSSREVAAVAAQHLLHQDFEGKQVRALLGLCDYSMAELAAAAGEVYVQQPYSPGIRFFYEPFNEGDFEVEPRTEATTSQAQEERFTLAYFLQHDLRLPQPLAGTEV